MAQLQRIAIASSQIQNGQIALTSPQQHYLYRVLRLQARDNFIAMDGMGQWWLAQLTGTVAAIIQPLNVATELPTAITLMAALPKGNAFDEVVRFSTELGVTCIAPLLSDRTLLKPSLQKLQRWQRISQEAAEQSERACIPTILEPATFRNVILNTTATHRYLCESRGNYPHLKNIINEISVPDEIAIAIGPEGGWTEAEIEFAIAHGFQPVSLGKRILRAVTAPIAALSIVTATLESVVN
ncbi:16S rRNA (uracil(1498)-N(3))-methyltransferase [Calothrix rhizosoleniae]|uniref:16S rRNA (uracil(1498)-N(3))-methyltransferase n=1 Tax=Calothrix rhizosoleniae TaxID=888997 RepID=UPI000B4A1DC8|nr:16S rRNA (uracil(1498)-N(3))-methyltransferase [Calothrix rhizosoleniae]